jgi:selenocysteine lyase/cysteine desulfurase
MASAGSVSISPDIRELFPGTKTGVYLNNAAESLFMASHGQALARYAERKALGSAGRPGFEMVEEQCRELVAQLLAVRPRDIAFIASTSRGLDVAIKSIDWRVGDNIVVADTEFPTTAFAATHLAEYGMQRRLVRARAGILRMDDFAEQIDDRTRIVVASLVSYKTGFKIDLAALAELAHAHGALVFVDAVQAAGAIKIDAGSADFLCAGTYKWLLGAHGLAALYVNPSLGDRIRPPYVAYRGVEDLFAPDRFDRYTLLPDARRFEEGMANYPGLHVLENALTFLLAIGVERIAAHNAALADRLMAGLLELGIDPLTPRDRALRTSIVSFETPDAARITSELAAAGIGVWGRDGRVRVSPGLYNTANEIDVFLEHLARLVEKTAS